MVVAANSFALPAAAPGTVALNNDVVGVSLNVPAEWSVQADPVLFNTCGFALFHPAGPRQDGRDRSPVARVALAYQARPDDIEGLVDG